MDLLRFLTFMSISVSTIESIYTGSIHFARKQVFTIITS